MNKRNIIIDCDPGIDDVIAISLAIANEDKLNILGISTVAGNQSIEKVTNNALKLVSFFDKNIKVAQGSKCPLIREKTVAKYVHGDTGMGNYELPPSKFSLYSNNAITFLRDTILNADGKVTLVPIGPLTNIALLIKTFPEVIDKIELLSIMGGATIGGNRTSCAEFNVWADPEAARIVFDSNIPIVMSGLNITHQTGLDKDDIKNLLNSQGAVSHMVGEILDFYLKGDHVNGGTFAPIHDACSIMYLIHPEIYEYKHMEVKVDCSEGLSRGNTVTDVRDWISYDESYPKVLLHVDSDKFKELLIEYIYKLDRMFER